MTAYRDRLNPLEAHTVRLDGAVLEFGPGGLLVEPSDETLAVMTASPLRRARFVPAEPMPPEAEPVPVAPGPTREEPVVTQSADLDAKSGASEPKSGRRRRDAAPAEEVES